MKTQDYILLIMNCRKYAFKADMQKNGWLKMLPNNILYYHVIGDETLDVNYRFSNEEKVLYVKVPDDYNSLPSKVIQSYLAVIMTFQFKYIFKTDDDQTLTDHHFFDNLIQQIEFKSPDYGGNPVVIQKEHISEYYNYHPELPHNIVVKETMYCNGRFYILSKNAVINVLEKMDAFKEEYFEDYAIGYHMTDHIKQNFLFIQNNVFIDS
jgi:hypothetical protein